jgi:hypothetical protein
MSTNRSGKISSSYYHRGLKQTTRVIVSTTIELARVAFFLALPNNRGAVIVKHPELKLRLPLCDIAMVIFPLIKLTPNVDLLVRARQCPIPTIVDIRIRVTCWNSIDLNANRNDCECDRERKNPKESEGCW